MTTTVLMAGAGKKKTGGWSAPHGRSRMVAAVAEFYPTHVSAAAQGLPVPTTRSVAVTFPVFVDQRAMSTPTVQTGDGVTARAFAATFQKTAAHSGCAGPPADGVSLLMSPCARRRGMGRSATCRSTSSRSATVVGVRSVPTCATDTSRGGGDDALSRERFSQMGADHDALDFAGAFIDPQRPNLTIETFDCDAACDPHSTMNLHRPVDDPLRRFSRVELTHGDVLADSSVGFVTGMCRSKHE